MMFRCCCKGKEYISVSEFSWDTDSDKTADFLLDPFCIDKSYMTCSTYFFFFFFFFVVVVVVVVFVVVVVCLCVCLFVVVFFSYISVKIYTNTMLFKPNLFSLQL